MAFNGVHAGSQSVQFSYCSVRQVANSAVTNGPNGARGVKLSLNSWQRAHFLNPNTRVPSPVTANLYTAPIGCALLSKSSRKCHRLPNKSDFTRARQRLQFQKLLPTSQKRQPARKAQTNALLKPFISQATTDKTIQLPINYYQVLQADKLSLPEKIVRAYEERVRETPGDGAPYSKAALAAREELLLIARNLLVNSDARRSYNIAVQNNDVGLVEVPWSQLPGALALLQEVGEEEVVLEVGRAALAERPPGRVFKQDVVLAMALSLSELAREAVNEAPPAFAQACQMLERALELLKEEGGKSFAPDLQDRIDTSLACLAPYCVLDSLAKPLTPEHSSTRKEGLTGARELLAAMAQPDSRWRHPDVMPRASFAEAAFAEMTAAEQVELYRERSSDPPPTFPELLSAARAHIAQGFMARKPELVEDADAILSKLSRELQQDPDSADVQRSDVVLERAMVCLLLGRVEEAKAHLGLATDPPTGSPDIAEYVYSNSDSFTDLLPGLCSLLERWLGEALLVNYREAADVSATLAPYFEDPHVSAYLEKLQQGSPLLALGKLARGGWRLVTRIASLPVRGLKWIGRGVAGLAAGLKDGVGAVTAAASSNGPSGATVAVRQSAEGRETVRESRTGRAELQRFSVGAETQTQDPVSRTMEFEERSEGVSAATRGPPFSPPQEQRPQVIREGGRLRDLDLNKFVERQLAHERNGDRILGNGDAVLDGGEASGLSDAESVSQASSREDIEVDDVARKEVRDNGAVSSSPKPTESVYKNRSNTVILVGGALLVAAIASAALRPSRKPAANQLPQTAVTAKAVTPPPKPPQQQILPKPVPIPTPDVETRMPPMDSVLAEGIIRRWQKAKAGALGARADVDGLRDVLDGAMLTEWTAKAREFGRVGKRWVYDLRGISVESVRVSNRGREAAVEVTLQERATEFDASQQPIESYEDEYRARYELKFIRGAGWRIVSGTVLT